MNVSSKAPIREYVERITTAVIPIDLIQPHEQNYNFHPEAQLVDLEESYKRRGQFLPKLVWQRPGGRYTLVIGEGFTAGAKRGGAEHIRCEVLPEDTPEEYVREILLADNLHARNSIPDESILARLLKEQQLMGVPLRSLGSDEEELRQMLETLQDEAAGLHTPVEQPSGLPNKRQFPFDMIYTFNSPDCSCCIAVKAGLRYGIQSGAISLDRICPYRTRLKRGIHEIIFVDNNYAAYDHRVHLSYVEHLRPKYATVRDVMTSDQCREAGIAYYSLEQVLDWAEELRAYAQNVIVIPKYDCLDQIPEHFMLGYSIPTSHGGTPLPWQTFKGRRVHLLGGSWKAQLAYMAALGDDVVSADNNMIHRLATFGQFVTADGEALALDEAGFGGLVNPLYSAFTLSVGAIGSKIFELCGAQRQDAVFEREEEQEEDVLCLR